MNRVIIIGNLGKDPESLKNGAAKFSVATSEKWKDKSGENVEHTEWHDVVCFGKTAELALSFLEKGRKVAIEGKIRSNTWENEDGETRKSTSIIADRLHFLSSGGGEGGSSRGGGSSSKGSTRYQDDEIPF